MKKTAGTLKTTQKDKISTVASLELALDLIEEDPNQPRNEFDPVTLQELASSLIMGHVVFVPLFLPGKNQSLHSLIQIIRNQIN